MLFRGYDSDLPFLLKLSWWLWFPIRKDEIYFKLYCMLYPLLELLSGKRGNIYLCQGRGEKYLTFDIFFREPPQKGLPAVAPSYVDSNASHAHAHW